jgi:hypothetical protein
MSAVFIPSISAAGLTLLTAADATAQLTALGGTAAIGTGGLIRAISPTFTTSINCGATFTAFAGAATQLTIGGTGGSSEVIIPGTKDASNTTSAAVRIAGGLGVAGKAYIGGYLNLGTATWLLATTTLLTDYSAGDTVTMTNAPAGCGAGTCKWIAIDDANTTRYIPTWEPVPS